MTTKKRCVTTLISFFGLMSAAASCRAPSTPPSATAAAPSSDQFDRKAALEALTRAAEEATKCARENGPRGSGKVAVTYANDGHATSAAVESTRLFGTVQPPQLIDAPTLQEADIQCIGASFLRADVPPFKGPMVTVHKSFQIR